MTRPKFGITLMASNVAARFGHANNKLTSVFYASVLLLISTANFAEYANGDLEVFLTSKFIAKVQTSSSCRRQIDKFSMPCFTCDVILSFVFLSTIVRNQSACENFDSYCGNLIAGT